MDDVLLSALPVPLIIGACLALFAVISTTNTTSSSSTSKKSRVARRRDKRKRGTGTGKLPVELVEHVIDFLQNDLRTLKQTALVSSPWLPRSRYHLNRKIVIRKGGPDPYSLRFYPSVAQCVREIQIIDNLCDEVSRSVLMDNPRIESLSIINSSGGTQLEISRQQFPYFPALTKLNLHKVSFHCGEELFDVLASQRRLAELRVDLSSIVYLDPSRTQFDASPTGSFNAMHTIHMTVRPNLNLGTVPHALLDRAGPALKELSIRILGLSTDFISAFQLTRDLDFSRNTSLESLKLIFYWAEHPWFNADPHTEQARQFATAVLASIHSRAFRKLRFDVVVPITGGAEQWLRFFNLKFLDAFVEPIGSPHVNAAGMDRAVAHAERLESVELQLIFRSTMQPAVLEDIEAHVRSQLPALQRRKLLRCTMMADPA